MRRIIAAIIAGLMLAPMAEARSMGMEEKLKAAFAAGELEGLHSVLILHKGEIFAEAYFEGRDEHWGQDLGVVAHGPDVLHDLRSITKSIVSLLYGIALAEGRVPPLDAVLVDQFPEYSDLAADPERREMTVEDALTMRLGLEWNEDLPYSDPRNSEIAMELAEDRYRFALSRPVEDPPGVIWTYSGGATALIGGLLEKGVGMSVEDYAAEKLFAPLGISDWRWAKGGDGVAAAASGLALSPRDLAKIGMMLLRGGRHDGRQIVPEDWLNASTSPQADTGFLQYGYFWWLPPKDSSWGWFAGIGNGGQRMSINPAADLVFIVFAGKYNQPDAWELPIKIGGDFLTPALEAARGGE